MATDNTDKVFDFETGDEIRSISFVKSVHIANGIDSDVYNFVGDDTQVLSIVKVKKELKTPIEKMHSGSKMLEGFLKGKGTLTVTLEGGTKNTYYFETEGYNKEVEIKIGQSVQWTAPKDADLVYYTIRDLPPTPEPVAVPVPEGRTFKLLLTSVAITDSQCEELVKLVGTPRKSIKMALIENAADVENNSQMWVMRNRQAIESYGFDVEIVDLKKYRNNRVELLEVLQTKNVIWIGGGNPFYLNWLLRVSRADDIIKYLVSRGVVYGGGSAGAIMAGPTLKYIESADDPNVVPEIGLDGLHLTETVVVPHADNPKFEKIAKDSNKKLKADGYKTALLKDDQALLINGDIQKVF